MTLARQHQLHNLINCMEVKLYWDNLQRLQQVNPRFMIYHKFKMVCKVLFQLSFLTHANIWRLMGIFSFYVSEAKENLSSTTPDDDSTTHMHKDVNISWSMHKNEQVQVFVLKANHFPPIKTEIFSFLMFHYINGKRYFPCVFTSY